MAEATTQPRKYERKTTPKGLAKFPALTEPDMKFKKDTGEYHTELLLDADAASTKELTAELEALAQEAFEFYKAGLKKKKAIEDLRLHVPFKEDTDKEGEPTGNVSISFKTGAKYKDKKTGELVDKKLSLFDGKGNLIETKVKVGGGSVIRVSYTPFAFYNASADKAGISLRINAIQIIKLKSYGASAADHGFGAEDDEDAFEAPKKETFEGSNGTPDENGGDY